MNMKRKSDIFPWDIFKSDTISFYQKILKYLVDFQDQNFSSFMTKVNPSNGYETKIRHFFMGHIQI